MTGHRPPPMWERFRRSWASKFRARISLHQSVVINMNS